jgi:hypothetical protein
MPTPPFPATHGNARFGPASVGQNLAELMFALPIFLVMLYALVEFSRVWHTMETARLAAVDAAHTAAIFHDANQGQAKMQERLSAGNLSVVFASVNEELQGRRFRSLVRVSFRPIVGGISIPMVGGPAIRVLPNNYEFTYTAVQAIALY